MFAVFLRYFEKTSIEGHSMLKSNRGRIQSFQRQNTKFHLLPLPSFLGKILTKTSEISLHPSLSPAGRGEG